MAASQKPRLKPPALAPGSTVGIVAPASAIQPSLLEAGVLALSRLGYKPFYLPSIFDQDLYFAGTVKRRARELEEMFERDDVRAIVCARGGYGSNYLLDELDIDKIAAHPKLFVGYSDVTTLLTYFADEAGFVTFHGPMVTKDFAAADGVHAASWNAAVSGKPRYDIVQAAARVQPLVRGAAEGTLYGGCLSMLVASLGTPYEVETDDTILFLEDVSAKPYQVDRMLMQLRLAGKFDSVRALVFGEMFDCMQHPDQTFTLQEVITRVVGDLGVPIAFGLRSGHVTGENITLPIGVRAQLAVRDDVRLTILEAAAEPAASAASRSGRTV